MKRKSYISKSRHTSYSSSLTSVSGIITPYPPGSKRNSPSPRISLVSHNSKKELYNFTDLNCKAIYISGKIQNYPFYPEKENAEIELQVVSIALKASEYESVNKRLESRKKKIDV